MPYLGPQLNPKVEGVLGREPQVCASTQVPAWQRCCRPWCCAHRYFLSHGASVAIVNCEGEVPSDLAEEPAMKDLLLEQVRKQGEGRGGTVASSREPRCPGTGHVPSQLRGCRGRAPRLCHPHAVTH